MRHISWLPWRNRPPLPDAGMSRKWRIRTQAIRGVEPGDYGGANDLGVAHYLGIPSAARVIPRRCPGQVWTGPGGGFPAAMRIGALVSRCSSGRSKSHGFPDVNCFGAFRSVVSPRVPNVLHWELCHYTIPGGVSHCAKDWGRVIAIREPRKLRPDGASRHVSSVFGGFWLHPPFIPPKPTRKALPICLVLLPKMRVNRSPLLTAACYDYR